MNIQEYLLIKLNEECGEIVQASSKALVFGADDIYQKKPELGTCTDRLVDEINDLLGVVAMLVEIKVIPETWYNVRKQLDKQEKIKKYMKFSQEKGILP